jgi:hypothetical protein
LYHATYFYFLIVEKVKIEAKLSFYDKNIKKSPFYLIFLAKNRLYMVLLGLYNYANESLNREINR